MMERTTFSDDRVKRAVSRFVAVRLDGSERSQALQSGRYDEAAERLGVRGLPTVVLLDPRGRLLDRIEGVLGPDELLTRLRDGEERCRAAIACR